MILPTLSWWKGSLVIKNASGRSLIMAVKALSNSSEQRTGSSELRTRSTLSQRLYQQQRPDLLADTRGQRRNQATSHRRLSGEIAVGRSRVRGEQCRKVRRAREERMALCPPGTALRLARHLTKLPQRAHKQTNCAADENIFDPKDSDLWLVRRENAKQHYDKYGE